jgi:predicted nucleotidyltransferase
MMHPNPQVINELVRRIGLFGSAARGELGPNSDLDVIMIMLDGTHERRTAQEIYCQCAAQEDRKLYLNNFGVV